MKVDATTTTAELSGPPAFAGCDGDVSIRGLTLKLMRGENLGYEGAESFVDALLDDTATDAQIAAALIALSMKGETPDELAGIATALRSKSVRISSKHETFVDTAGTGSSLVKTFNVSTAAAFVIAGAGVPVAKHGNRAVTSPTGSADVLAALGVNVSVDSRLAEQCLNEAGICFMFAPLYHGATSRVAAIRRELRIHTAFNLVGPLTNPAGAPRQIIGVWDRALAETVARASAKLGTQKTWVVHGCEGLDEVSVTGKTTVFEACHGRVCEFEMTPADFGLNRSSVERHRVEDSIASSQLIRDVLAGRRRDGARDLVVINAAAALFVCGKGFTLRDAASAAATSIDTGAAQMKLDKLIEMTNRQ